LLQFLAGFGHAGAILLAGLTALASDRAVLRAIHRPPQRAGALAQLQRSHRRVLAGLSLALLTGLTMLSAQLATLPRSLFLWIKLAGLATLLWNGLRILRRERLLRTDPQSDTHWVAMEAPARTSAILWCALALMGVLLTTV
jgi:threonine/homoserine/homoserine lactone efflux protein